MAEQPKYTLQYLYDRYKKKYKAVEMDRANEYNEIAMRMHGVDIRERYHATLAAKEQKAGPYCLGRVKKVKYG